MLEVLGQNERALANCVNDATVTQVRIEIHRADRRGVRRVMQGRIGMGAEMRRHGDGADVHRAAWPDLRGPSLLVGGVAGKRRRFAGDWRRNIPESSHEW